MTMTEHAVVISGGGPKGLMWAGELALVGVDVAIVGELPKEVKHEFICAWFSGH